MWRARKPLRRRMHVHRMSKRLRWRRPGANLRVATTLDLASRARTSHAVCRFPFVSPARVRELSHLVTLPKSTVYEYLKEKLNIASASQKVIGIRGTSRPESVDSGTHCNSESLRTRARGTPRSASTAHTSGPRSTEPSSCHRMRSRSDGTETRQGSEAQHGHHFDALHAWRPPMGTR